MFERQARFILSNRLGIHVRPAALLSNAANRHGVDIRVRNAGGFVNAKSLLGWLSLDAPGEAALDI